MGEMAKGIYPKTLIANGLLTAEQYKEYVHNQVVAVNEHKPVTPLFRFAIAAGLIEGKVHAQIAEQLQVKFKQTEPIAELAKIQKRDDDLFCQVLKKHTLLSDADITELQALCSREETGMELHLIALHSGYLPASVVAVAEQKVRSLLERMEAEQKEAEDPAERIIGAEALPRCKSLIRKVLKTRNHVALMEKIAIGKQDVIDYKDIPKLIAVDIEGAKQIVSDWKKVGVLRRLMGSVYNYGPDAAMGEDIKLFFKHWTNPAAKHILLEIIDAQ